MEKRKSFSRAKFPHNRQHPGGSAISGEAPAAPAPNSDSPVRRKSISTGGESPTSAASLLLPSPPRQKKSIPDPPAKLRKQRSADKIHISGALWPSAKNPSPITTLRDHFIEDNKSEEFSSADFIPRHATSTLSSRHSGGSDSPVLEGSPGGRKGRGRRSKENHQFGGPHSGKTRSPKKPATPPSPSSSSSSGQVAPQGRFSVDGNARARRRSDFGLDFPSAESDRSSTRNPSSRASRAPIKTVKIRKSGSPVRRSKSPSMRSSRSPVMHSSHSPVLLRRARSPAEVAVKGAGWNGGGMGGIISLGIGNLFRRKSFSSASVASTESSSAASATTIKSSPARGSAAIAQFPARGVQTGTPVAESQHSLKMAHNQLLQWRFLNGRSNAVNNVNSAAAEEELVKAWLGLSELRASVAQKRLQLAKQKLSFKLKTMIPSQIKGLERWGNMEKHHVAALCSTKNSFHAIVCRLPLTDHSKADTQILSILLRQTTKVADAINSNLAKCNSLAGRAVPLAAELAKIASVEKPLIEECYELLRLVSNMQVQEESLRCQLIQVKS